MTDEQHCAAGTEVVRPAWQGWDVACPRPTFRGLVWRDEDGARVIRYFCVEHFDDLAQRLADEAERGYDPDQLKAMPKDPPA